MTCKISKAVEDMSGLVEGIAEASSQQSNSVYQISQGIAKDLAVLPTMSVPCFTAFMEPSINWAVSRVASAVFCAKLRTSSATTAKPFPAFPARAASTAGLRAKILVWKAIASMVLIMVLIS